MPEVTAEPAYLGKTRAKMWTYLIAGGALLLLILVANFAIVNPDLARDGATTFLSLPAWAFPVIIGVLGLGMYVMGLKIEADWPELAGAVMIGGSVLAGEILLGINNFAIGGIAAIPYILPLVIFLGLMGYSMVKTK